MGTKNNPGEFDCYAAAAPDEPMFVLLARDGQAARLVEAWAFNREYEIDAGARADTPEARHKIEEARRCARDMRAWHAQHRPNTPAKESEHGKSEESGQAGESRQDIEAG